MIPPTPSPVITGPVAGDVDTLRRDGLALARSGEFESALQSLCQAVSLAPADTRLRVNLAGVLHSLGRHAKALSELDTALALDPDLAEIHNNRSLVLSALHRFSSAIDSAREAIRLKPSYAEAWNSLGVAQLASDDLSAAAASFRSAIRCNARYARAWANCGFAMQKSGQLADAIRCWQQALVLQPGLDELPGTLLHSKMRQCEWDGWSESLAQLLAAIEKGRPVSPPFAILSLIDSPAIHRRAAITASARLRRAGTAVVGDRSGSAALPSSATKKIRIGYFSADYFNHATTHLLNGVIESHDRNHFEIFGFSFGPFRHDADAAKIRGAFDQVFDTHDLSDHEMVELSRRCGVEIAVDLKGYTEDSRPGVFALRAAPIQVSFLGYPGTLAMREMDYLIADETLVPTRLRQYYDESLCVMPLTYQCNSVRPSNALTMPISTAATYRAALGLPADAFVFCCFNNTFKITPIMFRTWMEMLTEVPHAVLWLLGDNAEAERNLRNEAVKVGVDPRRLVFAGRVSRLEHLQRHLVADIFLDTTPYNAHTTASDALQMGLPVVTLIGECFPARVAASLLFALGMKDLVTESLNEYRALAIALAKDPARLQTIRQRLRTAADVSKVFDPLFYASALERGFVAMVQRHRNGHPPQDIRL